MPKDVTYLSPQQLGNACKLIKEQIFLKLHQAAVLRSSHLMVPSPLIQSLRQVQQLYPAHNIKNCND